MNREWILDKKYLSHFLGKLMDENELIAPVRDGKKDILFTTVKDVHEVVIKRPASIPSPKEFLFPQYEPMLRFSNNSHQTEDMSNRKKRAIFGIRSCDVSAIKNLDSFFLDKLEDPYYRERRNNMLLISIACNSPDPTCFCNSLGTGPYLKEGFDIQLTDLGDRYFLKTGSDDGIIEIRRMSYLLRRPEKIDYNDRQEIYFHSKAGFTEEINLEDMREKIISEDVKDDFWQWVASRCFECGGCVYECPLCTCFTVSDRKYSNCIERVRLWDACIFKGFTRMAGGVIPDNDKIIRMKKRYQHKLIHNPEMTGTFGCVGCGRCAIACPGRIDMATVASKIDEMFVSKRGEINV